MRISVIFNMFFLDETAVCDFAYFNLTLFFGCYISKQLLKLDPFRNFFIMRLYSIFLVHVSKLMGLILYVPHGSTTCLFVAVKAKKGDALLFFSLHLDASTDTKSLHGSCPVIEGEKWSATKWIHVRSFEKPTRASSERCVDENENCPAWAKRGECKKNPTYMVGSEGALGYCRKSCKAC